MSTNLALLCKNLDYKAQSISTRTYSLLFHSITTLYGLRIIWNTKIINLPGNSDNVLRAVCLSVSHPIPGIM